MTGREQMLLTRRGGLRADAAAKSKKKHKSKHKDDKKRPHVKRLPDTQAGRAIANSDFRLYLVDRSSRTDITQLTSGIDWGETSDGENVNSWPMLSGTITLHKDRGNVPFPDIQPNRIIDCYCQGERIWRMRVTKPAYTASDGTVNVELQDEIRQLALPRGNFRFVSNKSHKGGWTPDEIAKAICRAYKIPYSRFLVMRVNGTGSRIRLAKVDKKKASPLEVIQYAYEEARKRSAHRYVMRWDTDAGKLEAVPMRESDVMYEFTDRQITEANVEMSLPGNFCTALRVTWYKPKPKNAGKKWKPKKHTLKWTVVKGRRVKKNGKWTWVGRKTTAVLLPPNANDVIGKYGYVERRAEFSASSEKEARDRARNELAKRLRPKKALTFTVAGEPNIRRGDFLRVDLPEQGLSRKQMWVQAVTHSVGDNYTMEVTARFDNPFSAARIKKEQAAAKRYRKAAEKKEKKSSGGGSLTGGDYPRPAGGGTKYTLRDLVRLSLWAGFKGEEAAIAASVAMGESGGDPRNVSTAGNSPPSRDRGLWQFNDYWNKNVSDSCAFNPGCAAKTALSTRRSRGWKDWVVYNRGIYQQWMPQARQIVKQLGG